MTSTVVRSVTNAGTVAIVGGGCSGVLTARAVVRNTTWRTVLISPDDRPGCGVAYGAAQPWHVLNSRAAAMSVDSADPQHLVRWCRERGLPVEPSDFLTRTLYGDYLADQFAAAAEAAGSRLRRHTARAAAVRRDGAGFAVTDEAGVTVSADQVVISVGNPAPRPPAGVSAEALRSPAFVADPWAPGALDAIRPGASGSMRAGAPVLLLGTGLTAVDVALSLTAGGRPTRVEALSRRGLLPLAHPARPAQPVRFGLPAGPELSPLLRRLRQAVADGAEVAAVIDVVRANADRLWSQLDTAAQQRFLRHVQRYWEVHRHRMAPPVAERVAGLRRSGQLTVRAGHLQSITPHPDGGLIVAVRGQEPRWYAAVVTCTGPGPLPEAAGPLLAGMLCDGLVTAGPHGLGIDADADGRVIDARGRVQPGLWLVGPLRRGREWETTAVPEIRRQVDRLIEALPVPVG